MGLKTCLDDSGNAFTSEEKEMMIASSKKHKGDGKSELEADTMAVVDFHEKLQEELNKLRDKAKLPKEKVEKVIVEKDESRIKREEEAREKVAKINSVRRKIEAYNDLSHKDKIGKIGNILNTEIQDALRELGFGVKRLKNKGRLRLVDDNGKAVNKSPVKRSPEQIAEDMANKVLRKKAINATPVNVEHGVIMDIAAGYQFNLKEFVDLTHTPTKEVPPLLFTNKEGGLSFEFYKERLRDNGFDTTYDNQEVAQMAADELSKYADKVTHKDFRAKAMSEAIRIYREIENNDANQGMSPEEIAHLENLQKLEDEMKDAAEKFLNERELSEEEIKEELDKEKARIEYEKEKAGDQYQKSSSKATPDIQKVVDVIKKALPKFTVKYDEKLEAAGKIQGNVITINPYYAGKDTPIHEAGHALIDFLGTKDKVVATAIKQLQGTKLWAETKERYPELSDEQLSKEVLAEAIGREGADIFDSEVAKGKFKQLLDRIFEKLKQLLGLDKNAVKRLAKQIIRGDVRDVAPIGEGKKVSLQMPSGEKVDGKEVQVDVVNGFYSNLEKMLLQVKLDKLPAKQWKDKLTGEEAKWTGLTDWLNSQQGSVSKKDIQNFLKKIGLVL